MRGLGLSRGIRRLASAPQPVPVWSQDDLSAGWTAFDATIGGAGIANPEVPEFNAVSVLETATTAQHFIVRTIPLVNGVTYRLRVAVKTADRPAVTINVADGGGKYWYGNVGSAVEMLASGMSNAQADSLGGGWYAQSVDFTFEGATGDIGLFLGISLDPVNIFYAGDIAKGLIFGSVKLYDITE